MARTLDVDLPQVALDFYDEEEFTWHHRLLLVQVDGSKWVVSTPDHDVEVVNLADHKVVTLEKAALFPRRVKDDVYTFDPVSDNALENLLRRGRALARVLGVKDVEVAGPPIDSHWRVGDTGSERFDDIVDEAEMLQIERAVVRGDLGLYRASASEAWVYVERVKDSGHDAWLELKRSGPGRDLRICGVRRDGAGERSSLLRDSLGDYRSTDFKDWPFEGPSAAAELLKNVSSAGLELHLYPGHWESRSGVSPTGAVAREVRLAFDYLRHFQAYDQLDLPNLAGIECICRRIIVCQRAVRKNPKAPDFGGLEQFLQSSFDESGGLLTSEFDKYMAEQQRTAAVVLKQNRLWSEEVDAEKKKQAVRGGGNQK